MQKYRRRLPFISFYSIIYGSGKANYVKSVLLCERFKTETFGRFEIETRYITCYGLLALDILLSSRQV